MKLFFKKLRFCLWLVFQLMRRIKKDFTPPDYKARRIARIEYEDKNAPD